MAKIRNIAQLWTRVGLEQALLVLSLLLTTTITGEQHGDYLADMFRILKILTYSTAGVLVLLRIWSIRKDSTGSLQSILQSYPPVFFAALLLYFLGQLIGALHGPSTLFSLWQTASDGIVFMIAFLYFGWLATDTSSLVRSMLIVIAIGTSILLLGGLAYYISKLPDLSVLIPLTEKNYELLTLPFNHPNHYAYILMVGTMTAGFEFFDGNTARRWLWALPIIFLLYGLNLTGGRGAILGTGTGLLGILIHRHHRLGAAGMILLLLGSALISITIIFLDPEKITSRPDTIQIENRTFDIFDTWDDDRWQEWVEKNGGLVPIPSNRTIQTNISQMQPGYYQIVTYGFSIPYQVDEKSVPRMLPDLHVRLYHSDLDLLSSTIRTATGKNYLTCEPFELSEVTDLKLEMSLVLPDTEVDLNSYIFLQHVLVLPGKNIAWILRFHNLLPKTTFASRPEIWAAGLNNLKAYGPLGVGAGNAESWPGMGMHNMFMEQYGEGGVLGLIGFLGWIFVPIFTLKNSRLDRKLAWGIVAMMAGLLVHGIFWDQFLNGLRFLTLVYVCLWTALATRRVDSFVERQGKISSAH